MDQMLIKVEEGNECKFNVDASVIIASPYIVSPLTDNVIRVQFLSRSIFFCNVMGQLDSQPFRLN